MYRVGIIGCGFIGVEAPDSHFKAYQDCRDTEVVALCDKEEWKADRLLPDENIELITASYWDMLRLTNPDIVSVCSSVETHCQIVCDIAPYVKAIYCEKPIATTLEDADRMIETCHKYNVILQVNHQRRFIKPKMRWSRGILNNGTHAIDLVRQLCGDEWQDKIELEYVDSMDYPPVFELDINRSDRRPILKGVEHLVQCLKEGKQSLSSGEEARKTLHLVLVFVGQIILDQVDAKRLQTLSRGKNDRNRANPPE
tara:strand:+ start:18956 stop:19720 length:765 start_codon:yes stop_codon:yes gene_type:complete